MEISNLPFEDFFDKILQKKEILPHIALYVFDARVYNAEELFVSCNGWHFTED
ncbi:hypothetical protein ACSAZL_16260 [Methanosarcina sp. T3]|uniref:hypothetical protein n=1 Tax=Methanosarcina sp. T3 TaxID=3439062 RepID=UPI003F86D7DB